MKPANVNYYYSFVFGILVNNDDTWLESDYESVIQLNFNARILDPIDRIKMHILNDVFFVT